jgi:DNA-binding PadR family transcriptional regulator
MKESRLREFEELVLLAVRMNGRDACGASIQRTLESEARRSASLGAIYTALDRLARKGLVESWMGEPTPVRGGRRKRHYGVTPAGLKLLSETRRIRESMWAKIGAKTAEKEVMS